MLACHLLPRRSRNRTSQIGRLLEVALRAGCILSLAPAGANQSERVKSRWTDGHAPSHFQPFSFGPNYETETGGMRVEILKYYRYDNIDVFLADIIDIFRKYR
jgi:hypothetical protein